MIEVWPNITVSIAGPTPFLRIATGFVESSINRIIGRRMFVLALQMCLPGLPLDDLLWRYNMMVGALIYAMAGPQRMTRRPLVFGTPRSTGSERYPEDSGDER